MSINAGQSGFLGDLFDTLTRRNIGYCVLRNHGGLPHALNGSDLDLLVDNAKDVGRARAAILESAEAHGGMAVISSRAEVSISCLFGIEGGSPWGAQVDVFNGLYLRGIKFWSAGEVLRRAVTVNGVRVACDGDAAIVALLKECVANCRSRKNYDRLAAEAFSADSDYFTAQLHARAGSQLAGRWATYFGSAEDASELRRLSKSFRRTLFWHNLRGSPISTVSHVIGSLARRARRLLSPSGRFIVVHGNDAVDAAAWISPALTETTHGHLRVVGISGRLPGVLRLLATSHLDRAKHPCVYLVSIPDADLPFAVKLLRPALYLGDSSRIGPHSAGSGHNVDRLE